jgi:predicted nucleotidyltransferase component of viral defense system
MHEITLAKDTKTVLDLISKQSFHTPFYLSGGTALALYLGHRESEDLNFFTESDFDPNKLLIEIEKIVKTSSTEISKNTLNCYIQGVKVQFLGYPYKLLSQTTSWNNINISSVKDIACTKLLTISARGSKKDFIDMYFILKKYSLEMLFKLLEKKYSKTSYNQVHILKSLAYFEDADLQPMPRMHTQITWDTVKEDIVKQLKLFKFS